MGSEDRDLQGRTPRWWFLPVRPLSALLFVVLAGGGITAAAVSRQVVDEQEQRLLDQRAVEAGGLLTLSGTRLQEAFRSMTTLLPLTGVSPAAFSPVARPVVDAGLFDVLAVAQAAGGGYQVLVAEGTGVESGQALPAEVIPTVERAGPDGAYVTSPVFTIGGERRIGLAALVAGLSPRTLVYGQSVIEPPVQEGDSGATRAFADLEAAVYVGDEVDPDQLVISTPSKLPLRAAPPG